MKTTRNTYLIGRSLRTVKRVLAEEKTLAPKVSCVPQKTHSQQAMTKVKYVLVLSAPSKCERQIFLVCVEASIIGVR
jgi:hypothetical protein